MIYLEELFCRLANGTLQNLSLAEGGEIDEDQKTKVVIAINEALTRLHSRFILKENTVIVEMQEGRTTYPLLKKYAVSSYDPASGICPYIMDLAGEPFNDDVIKILSVYDSNGCKRALNDPDDCRSLFSPRPNYLQNPSPRNNEAISVLYQANHVRLSCAEDANDDGIIDIPEVLDSALDSYVAFRLYSGINTAESKASAQEMLGHYDSVCNEVVSQDLLSTSYSYTGSRFQKRGWI
ncbi:hypothetical protein Axy22_070 [Achromobacter phage vB_AxyP_19-32_Axy22]|uniref:Uncharacterized protein n=2 Tax=Pourcelvirus TaxID=2842976 RepID=A0A514CVV6_9CAUD|nr:virion structural protein [Achromobacter phage vB_AxyP_19-32_Axy10]QDH83940.1 hypothetical protein Axy10_074 [Achromobacter phage vB_AxyP_19-32_Axy10]QDH84617.1 hypothetical protein Axy22_070 [Achromobacter phage vB_AxyP_19-32_Axy22]